jgi:uncharacterized membrane protein
MNQKTTQANSLLAASERIYSALLILYPTTYRREYGRQMVLAFRDICWDAYRRDGMFSVLESWLSILLDLFISVIEERRREGFHMSKSIWIRLSGPILIIAGVLFVAFSFSMLNAGFIWEPRGIYQVASMMIVPSFALLSVGLVGVCARYWPLINRMGRLGLVLAIASASAFAIIFLLAVAGIVPWDVMDRVEYTLFLLHHFGTMLFGIATIQTRSLPRWNALPLLLGLLPLLIFLTRANNQTYGNDYVAFGLLFLVGLGYALLGYVVLSNVSRRELAAA